LYKFGGPLRLVDMTCTNAAVWSASHPSRLLERASLLMMGGIVGCSSADVHGDDAPFDRTVADAALTAQAQTITAFDREPIAGDIYHYSLLLRVGDAPNARIRLHRVVRESGPFRPKSTRQAVMMTHGSFATFSSNFLSTPRAGEEDQHRGLAVHLAERGVDVWGLDRRWATTPAGTADVSDYPSLGFATSVDDIRTALAFARVVRSVSGQGADRMTLMGFSIGALLTYSYAAAESVRPARERHVKAIVPIDIYARIAPENEELRLKACKRRDVGLADMAGGFYDVDNSFIQQLGSFAQTAPDDPSPVWPGLTSRQALYTWVAQTYFYYGVTPFYHLNGGHVEGENVTSLNFTADHRVEDWHIGAPPHEAYVEGVDMDTILCNEGPLPLEDHLADVRVPIFNLAAAGGFGEYANYSTSVTRSTDVTNHVVRRLPRALEVEDEGHADLLFARDAPELAWPPLAAWIARQ
jgi:pimeloyl-ACP methyl ester carboxylesterase